jgi:lysophospholipase L1-like esterase
VILAFGDSLTFGTGASAAHSYPAVLQQLTGRPVVRAGVPGEVTADGLKRLPAVLDEHQPKLVIICHGGNDLIRRKGKPQLTDNLRAMVRLAEAQGADVLLVGVPEPGLLLSTADIYPQLAEELSVPLEGEALATVLGTRSLKSDTIHPNAAGYRQLAQAIAEVLEQHGAL